MKTVITSKGNNQKAMFDPRFGRAGWFCMFDDASGKPDYHMKKNNCSTHQ